MSIRIPKYVWFILAYAFAVVLYWPAMNGGPIWDDNFFWFSDPMMSFPYSDYWKNFAWPLSVSAQKVLLNVFGKNYSSYHVLNLLLHFANSYLVYRLARLLKLRFAFMAFFLFLIHPASVIATAWMIQIKTLLCFFFGILSFLCFLKGQKRINWMIASWVFFALSVLSKSASIPLAGFYVLLSFHSFRFKKIHLVIPFILISSWGLWKLMGSKVALEYSQKASEISQIKEQPVAPAVKPIPMEPPPVKKDIKPKKKKKRTPVKEPENIQKQEARPPKKEQKSGFDPGLIGQTLNYYFWQGLVPHNNVPVKGLNYSHAGIMELVHVFFLLILVALLWKEQAIFYLGAIHLLLLPFIGFIPAPYMNVTWVSDQHLYLVLPAFLGFWLKLTEKIKSKYAVLIPVLIAAYFSWKTFEATKIYRNEIVFYENCLQHDPLNVPIAFNLVLAHVRNGEAYVAYNVAEDVFRRAQTEPLMLRNPYYPYLADLYIKLRSAVEKAGR